MITKQELVSRIEKYCLGITIDFVNHIYNSEMARTLIDVATIHTATTIPETIERIIPAIQAYERMAQAYPINIKIPKGSNFGMEQSINSFLDKFFGKQGNIGSDW